ncbi:MAG: DUF3786 domain-containing protein [Deltaproteobacteria bacterium]|nr:DUF3786 domain-containing protein [Deltaproteobacteria bacterium]MBW2192433.1 DUF3786 domain-containing protein [Deltaproteobacteria bacterium]
MASASSVFEETYKKYMGQIANLNFKSIEAKLGIRVEADTATIPFFGHPYTVSSKGIVDPSGKQPRLETSVVLCNYLLRCPDAEPVNNDWVSYRDFKDSGPLTAYFANAVEKPVADHFSGRLGALEKSCKTLGGFPPDMELSYELSMQFSLLPKIPALLLFNDADDEFPAHCSILFERRAEKYLDAESLAILGMLFFVCLKKKDKDES